MSGNLFNWFIKNIGAGCRCGVGNVLQSTCIDKGPCSPVRQLCVQLDSDPQPSQYRTTRSNRYEIVPTSLLFLCIFTVDSGLFVKLGSEGLWYFNYFRGWSDRNGGYLKLKGEIICEASSRCSQHRQPTLHSFSWADDISTSVLTHLTAVLQLQTGQYQYNTMLE